jgi:2-C-methyl-D-erythritol 4-phosphate cytidylyltransferase
MTELTDISLTAVSVPRCWALIPCAGTGSRAGVAGPKAIPADCGQVPMVLHTLAAFAEVARIDQTLVVVSPDDRFFQTPQALNASFVIASCGGSTRAGSVFNGLNALLAEGAVAHDWVLVHDAARCLITPAQINQLLDACLNDEVGGLLALPLPDTLKAARADRVTSHLAAGG